MKGQYEFKFEDEKHKEEFEEYLNDQDYVQYKRLKPEKKMIQVLMKCENCKEELIEGKNIHKGYHLPVCKKCRLILHKNLNQKEIKNEN